MYKTLSKGWGSKQIAIQNGLPRFEDTVTLYHRLPRGRTEGVVKHGRARSQAKQKRKVVQTPANNNRRVRVVVVPF
jgi:hypothetical protein